jgi:NTE family protein
MGLNNAARRGFLGAGAATGWAAVTAGLGGCAVNTDFNHAGPDAPGEGPLPRKPRTAWVFSSGGPRGFVHVGVIKALDELGLAPDLIVGASAGAAVGVLCAAGRSGQELEALAMDLPPLRIARLAVGSSEMFAGDGVADMIREHSGQRLLQHLPVPAVCVVQRLADGAVMGFNQGDVGVAVQAACAIQGQFAPVRVRGQRYADADLRLPLPVRLARALGATHVLAVDASAHEDKAPESTGKWREADLRKRALTRPDAEAATVLLHPEFGYYASVTTAYRQRCIAAGYQATMAKAEALKAMHAAG